MHDQLLDGRPFRMLTVIDQWGRECALIGPDFRMSGQLVAAVLEAAARSDRLTGSIRVDRGTEFTSRALDAWAWQSGVELDFIRPRKPTENGMIKSFNGRMHDECLNCNAFVSINDARHRIEAWRNNYNGERPHSALGNLTPREFVEMHQPEDTEAVFFQLRTVSFSEPSSQIIAAQWLAFVQKFRR